MNITFDKTVTAEKKKRMLEVKKKKRNKIYFYIFQLNLVNSFL